MPSEFTARADRMPSDAPEEGDYEAFCEALSGSARGRTFLAEYTRRNRNAETEQLLGAIERLQAALSAKPGTADQVKARLRGLLDEIGAAQRELDENVSALRATRLADLVALVERRISDIMAIAHEDNASGGEPAEPAVSDEAIEVAERVRLAIVPPPEQPELPIPSPDAAQPPPITLVRSETIMAEVSFVELPPVIPELGETSAVIKIPTIEARVSQPVQAPIDEGPLVPEGPLAPIMALREEERLALFT
jgi:hypothetical protein